MIMFNVNFKKKQRGFLVLTMVLLVCVTVLAVVTGILLRSVDQVNQTADSEKALQAWGAVSACGEYALGKMMASTSATTTAQNWAYAGSESLSIPLPDGRKHAIFIL